MGSIESPIAWSPWERFVWWWGCYSSRMGSIGFVQWCGQRWCGVSRGHLYLPIFGYGKLALRCAACQHETPGWQWRVKHQSNVLRFGARGFDR